MQVPTPSSFPRKVKRFQSYSMTPLDLEYQSQNQSGSNTTTFSNKFNWLSNRKKIGQQSPSTDTNTNTNQFSTENKSKLFTSDKIIFKHNDKCQFQNEILQFNSAGKMPLPSEHKSHVKMVSSQIFQFSSMANKNSFSDDKHNRNLYPRFVGGERKSYQNEAIKKHSIKLNKNEKSIKVPSFLQNKKKLNLQNLNNEALTERQMCQSTPLFDKQRNQGQSRTNSKKLSIENGLNKILKNDEQQEFRPPSKQKIIFSKATASTLYTNLPRQQSRNTFKDFEEMGELKQIQNSIEESDNIYNLQNEFDGLFRRQSIAEVHPGILQNQIAELFSDEDMESEQFNEELQHELQDLF